MCPELEVIIFSNTGSYPGTMVIEFSNTSSAKITMFGSIFFSAIANRAKVMLISLVLKQFVFL